MRTVTQAEHTEQPMEQPAGQQRIGWLHVRIPGELRRQVNIRAAADEKSVADVVAEALEKHLRQAAA